MSTVQERHPQVFVQRRDDPRERKRTVPMEVLSLGMMRTGTMTMKAAFEILGIPTWHWVTMTENTADLAMWREALETKFEHNQTLERPYFDQLLGNWGATTDQPPSLLAEDLIAAYPEAKVVLVERDADRWYESFNNTVIAVNTRLAIPLGAFLNPAYLGQMRDNVDLVAKYYFNVDVPRSKHWLGLVNPEWLDRFRENAKPTYREHNENIKRITPKDRLLLFRLEEGWEPLCKFLGKSVPGVPFPRVNETAALQEKVSMYIRESYKRSLVSFSKKASPFVMVLLAVMVWRMTV